MAYDDVVCDHVVFDDIASDGTAGGCVEGKAWLVVTASTMMT